MRLDRFLTEQNMGSRSQVKDLIKKGLIQVNGEPVIRPELHIDPAADRVVFRGRELNRPRYRYYMLNKPGGVVSARKDPKDRTVLDLFPADERKDLFPAGRLDKDTEGLLLLTNDGDLAHRILSPKKHVDKTYFVRTDLPLTAGWAKRLEAGVEIGEKHPTLPARIRFLPGCEREVEITIQEGKYHQIKRMFQTAGLQVLFLKRLRMGPLVLDERLAPGEYRSLTENELARLKGLTDNAAGKESGFV